MTLEAGKEMDKRCVLNWLTEVYVTPSRAFIEYTEDELKMFAHDAISLLKEQEEVEPYQHDAVWLCGYCTKEVVGWTDDITGEDIRYPFCRRCGRSVKWE